MGFAFIIIMRILFVASMVFIIGYIFGGFSKKPALKVLAKISAILVIVLFIASNVFLMRVGGWHRGHNNRWPGCDSVSVHHKDAQLEIIAPVESLIGYSR